MKKMFEETYDLANGVLIPKIGFGTWQIEGEAAENAVVQAIATGYRHIDTAQAYGNEEQVGNGVRKSGIKREDIFVTDKVEAEIKNYEQAKTSIAESLRKSNFGYFDLMLIHCPQPWAEYMQSEYRYFKENKEVWKALEEAYKEGKVKAIGVSNFMEEDLDNLLEDCEIRPMVNQVMLHVGFTPFALLEKCRKEGIVVEAHSPIAHGRILENETLVGMAKKYGVSVARLCIKYALNLDTVVLPKSCNPDHMKENADMDFEISEEDMDVLKNIPMMM